MGFSRPNKINCVQCARCYNYVFFKKNIRKAKCLLNKITPRNPRVYVKCLDYDGPLKSYKGGKNAEKKNNKKRNQKERPD